MLLPLLLFLLLPTVTFAQSGSSTDIGNTTFYNLDGLSGSVAHHAADRDSNFYTDNKMTLTKIEDALIQLEALLNHLSWNVLAHPQRNA
jgi:hypothetical protein